MNAPAFLRPRDATFWVYAIVVAAAVFWRGPQELSGAGLSTILLWAALTCVGAAVVAVLGWALDPHAVLPRSLLAGGFGWGAACAVLVARTDRDAHQLTVKVLGLAKGDAAARWLAVPLTHNALAILGTFLLLSLASEHALRPTDGMKLGMSCGFGLWAGGLLLALARGAFDHPAGGLIASLAEGLPHWFALAAAPWAAPAIAGYGFCAARTATGAFRRLGIFAVAVLGSAACACVQGGVAGTGLGADANAWPWVWAATAGFSFTFALLVPARSPAWWTAIGFGIFGAAALIMTSGAAPIVVLAAFTPLAFLGFWRSATRAEGVWLEDALSDESDEVRTGCAQAAEVIDVRTRRSAAAAALASFGPKARPLAVQLRSGQIRLAKCKALLAEEQKAAGAQPDSEWRAWLAHLTAEVDEQRGSIRTAVAEMAKEEGVYQ